MQKTQEKGANHLSPASSHADARPERKSYDKVITCWAEDGDRATLGWRRGFLFRLKQKGGWHDLISEGGRGLREDERENIRGLLNDADGDPLMYLNLSGIPPITILRELEAWKAREDSLTRLRERLRSKTKWREDLKLFEKTERTLDAYRPLLGDEGNQIKESLAKAASTIESVQRHNRLPPGTQRKGEPPRIEFPPVVICLVWILIVHLIGIGRLQERSEKEIRSLLRPYWGPITAILMAAFPQWFTTREGKPIGNPIRNVKNAYNYYGKLKEAIETPAGDNVWLYAPPGHLKKLKWWEATWPTRRKS